MLAAEKTWKKGSGDERLPIADLADVRSVRREAPEIVDVTGFRAISTQPDHD